MKYRIKRLWPIFIILLLIGIWYLQSQRGKTSAPAATQLSARNGGVSGTPEPSSKDSSGSLRPKQPNPVSPLQGVQSTMARRYLAFLLPGGRQEGKSYGESIVNNAFKQAWSITARLDLSESQQDRLAEFLMQEEWRSWTEMKPEIIQRWAGEHLSKEQQSALQAFIDESKAGHLALIKVREADKMKEYGAQSPQEAFAAELAETKKMADLLATNTEGIDEKELEKKRSELKELMKKRVKGDAGEKTVSHEQSARFYNVLADRIPLTGEQHTAVYAALRKGRTAPINPYDYQSKSSERAEAAARADTSWMASILTKSQYDTYVRHFLAEIETIRFQQGRR